MSYFCKTCSRLVIFDNHICPPRWFVCNEEGFNEGVYDHVYAYTIEEAAEKYVEIKDWSDSEFTEESIVCVLDKDSGCWIKFKVTGELIRQYKAEKIG